ncbi:TlpA family protein disulfide reductase [Rhizorhapis sp. SPR117]|uniref:TlpA family protein disulfide reductase n=1 Tax=Rhizorhapis sp. SPR117 TaxID=2912611 RepID=UPI0030C8448F
MRCVIAILLLATLPVLLSACDKQSAGAGQENAQGAAAPKEEKASNSESGGSFTIDTSHAGEAAPDFTFEGPDGGDVMLADFKGKPLLVNLWATWCGPCVLEMPTLDQLAIDHNGKLQVVVISQDSQGRAKVDPFFKERKFAALQPYIDAENQFGFHYGSGLLPTTVLYDAEGKEVARVLGALDWRGKEATELIAAAL